MHSLIYVPLMSVFKYRSFKSIFLITLAYAFMAAYLGSSFDTMIMEGQGLNVAKAFAFPEVFLTVRWFMKFANYFLSFLIIMMVCDDEALNIIRQRIVDGWSREEVYFSYTIVAFALATMVVLLSMLMAISFGVKGLDPYFSLQSLCGLLFFGLQSFLTFIFVISLALLLKRGVLCIFTFITWQFILEPMISVIAKYKFEVELGDYLPFGVFSKLLQFPDLLGGTQVSAVPEPLVIWLSCAYGLFFMGLGLAKMKWSDF